MADAPPLSVYLKVKFLVQKKKKNKNRTIKELLDFFFELSEKNYKNASITFENISGVV